MTHNHTGQPRPKELSADEVRAIAYGIADEVQTRALALIAKEPGLDHDTAILRAVLAMGAA